ncbi:NADPH-dependent 7-cyano-7-deazaguanine reductase QueF [Legionella taurinensis]|uniref:NADPH-dependent 7-cyano-7-deazaguanine reductase n=2 Tax=Legionella taurinensis TaxID=70611 RepID=A0A3A5L182_9GAMM|nr:NADPH-dependent 7-cyano-7-deazaguanine reductase QueF [Legionella taurinensis]PUT38627.1 NADPH-dependent 7-cyano-7-deazaguanine reductase QueF [Legionella taurinensis]PUT39825.1 NADPH-dependent 7-cyano-7-deazaguanine reductase QueF [Legionella taurinensis]PUT41817.1 NADPH-dependent 7-cyano-7-deazaguanine reductase QueF [Legionella taurinensis]PUT45312.1 NADPH-dependent 7-cyano-7-deazaguanine reductase QueF [Legionella taurinensis]RJT43966.1 NADPH-dependent 7-cyano-7-deazaguanine reductase Q
MRYYQIKEISRLTSLSVRSLQYYDERGLLKPSKRSDAGYRLYSDADLLRLQQIVTLKYLGFSLNEIKKTLNDPQFDIQKSLVVQARLLAEKARQLKEASALLTYIAAQREAKQAVNWRSTAEIIAILELSSMNPVKEQYNHAADASELGRKSDYDASYNPLRLYPIPRAGKRQEIGIHPEQLPFYGFDCWNHYEVSWLNEKGKPIVAMAEIDYDCRTPMLVESKSLKLYFNSFNNTRFKSLAEVVNTIKNDLEQRVQGEVRVAVHPLGSGMTLPLYEHFNGECIDNLDVECSIYTVEPSFLTVTGEWVEETLYSDLLKSNCLVTNQPDWGSVQISYKGQKINREGLLQYLVSFRNHNEFHEQCIERIFIDIMRQCQPEELTVYGRYTRRGGLDINPYRSTKQPVRQGLNFRLPRQ